MWPPRASALFSHAPLRCVWIAGGFTNDERELLAKSPDPVFAVAQRIQRAIMTRMHAGGLPAPPPIISRVFQEISNGLLAYNNATKMKEIAVPFAYVQLNAIFLNIYALILSPIAIAIFCTQLWLAQVRDGLLRAATRGTGDVHA